MNNYTSDKIKSSHELTVDNLRMLVQGYFPNKYNLKIGLENIFRGLCRDYDDVPFVIARARISSGLATQRYSFSNQTHDGMWIDCDL